MVFMAARSGILCARCTTAQVFGSDQSIASICDELVDMLHHVVVELFAETRHGVLRSGEATLQSHAQLWSMREEGMYKP